MECLFNQPIQSETSLVRIPALNEKLFLMELCTINREISLTGNLCVCFTVKEDINISIGTGPFHIAGLHVDQVLCVGD